MKTARLNPEINVDGLKLIGVETLRNKYAFKVREGFDHEKTRIPNRILETESPLGRLSRDDIKRGIAAFFKFLE